MVEETMTDDENAQRWEAEFKAAGDCIDILTADDNANLEGEIVISACQQLHISTQQLADALWHGKCEWVK